MKVGSLNGMIYYQNDVTAIFYLQHVKDEQHKEFIREKAHYQALDSLINSGPNEATFLQRVLQQHCSIVSGTHR